MTHVYSKLAAMTRCIKPLGIATFGVALAISGRAFAEPNFPAEIQSHLNLTYTPPCTFCHATAQGAGPVTTKFGQSMLAAGLTINVSSVGPALDKLKADNTDSDGDGMPDIQQIEQGFDPSTGLAPPDAPRERYGCGARTALSPVRFKDSSIIALCLVGLVVFARRRVPR